MQKRVYVVLARAVGAYHRCVAGNNLQWRDRHKEHITTVVKDKFPSGSGFDRGTVLDLDLSTEEKLVFLTSFHHMDGHGFYDGWTDHAITVRGSLAFGFKMTISGPNRNDIKELIHQNFELALNELIEEYPPVNEQG